MPVVNFPLDVNVQGRLSCETFSGPDAFVDNDAVAADAAVEDTKLIHRFPLRYGQEPGANVVAATVDLHIVQQPGFVRSIEAALTGVVPDGDRTVTIQLQNGDAGGAFASILSAALVLDSGNALRTPEAGTITTPAIADGDILRVTVAVAGSTGAQPQGLIITVQVAEQP
jgi:hypothetical protein